MSIRRAALLLLPLLALYTVVLAVTYSAPGETGDEPNYLEFASNLTRGFYTDNTTRDVWPAAGPDLWFGPGLPLLLSPFVVLNLPLAALRWLAGPLCLYLAVVMFYRLMIHYVGPRSALLVALALGFYWPFYTTFSHIHSEPLVILLLNLSMSSTVIYLRAGKRINGAIAALALGWLVLTRVGFGYVLLVMALLMVIWWFFRRAVSLRRLAVIHVIALLVCIPWLIYTFSVAGRALYWGSSGGLSLYWMSSPHPGDLGDWYAPNDVLNSDNESFAPHRPLFEELLSYNGIERDLRLQQAALENIQANPINYIENVANNMSRMVFSMPFSRTNQKLSTMFYALPNSILLGMLVVAVPILLFRWRHTVIELFPFMLFAVLSFGIHSLLSAYARMLLPIVPVVFWVLTYAFTKHFRIAEDSLYVHFKSQPPHGEAAG